MMSFVFWRHLSNLISWSEVLARPSTDGVLKVNGFKYLRLLKFQSDRTLGSSLSRLSTISLAGHTRWLSITSGQDYWTYCHGWPYDEYSLSPITKFIQIFHTLIFIGRSQGRYIPRLRKLLSESDSDDSESPAPSDQVSFVEVSFVSNKSYIAKTKDSLFLSLTGATKKKKQGVPTNPDSWDLSQVF